LGVNDRHQEQIIEWYNNYSLALYKYILKIIKDTQQAEDLTQDTFMKAYTYITRGKDVTYPKTFLYRIAHNLTIDYIRKNKPVQMIKDFFTNKEDPQPSVEAIIESQESSKELFDALSVLKMNYRQVIILRKVEEFSIRETAEILNWSENKVKSTLYRGLKALANEIDKGGAME